MKEHAFDIGLVHESIRYEGNVTPLLENGKSVYRVRLIDQIHIPYMELTIHQSGVYAEGEGNFWIQQEEENRSRMKNHDFVQAVGLAISKEVAARMH